MLVNSGFDSVLTAMNIEWMPAPIFATDIICGSLSESETDFEEIVTISQLHPCLGILAARMTRLLTQGRIYCSRRLTGCSTEA